MPIITVDKKIFLNGSQVKEENIALFSLMFSDDNISPSYLYSTLREKWMTGNAIVKLNVETIEDYKAFGKSIYAVEQKCKEKILYLTKKNPEETDKLCCNKCGKLGFIKGYVSMSQGIINAMCSDCGRETNRFCNMLTDGLKFRYTQGLTLDTNKKYDLNLTSIRRTLVESSEINMSGILAIMVYSTPSPTSSCELYIVKSLIENKGNARLLFEYFKKLNSNEKIVCQSGLDDNVLFKRYFKYGRPVRYRYFGDFLNQTVFDTICFKYTSHQISAYNEDELDKLHLIQQAYYYCLMNYLMNFQHCKNYTFLDVFAYNELMISSVSAFVKFDEFIYKFKNIEELKKYVEIFNNCLVDFCGNEIDTEKYQEGCREDYEKFGKNEFPTHLSFREEDRIFVITDGKNNRRLYSEMVGDITPSQGIHSSFSQTNLLENDISQEKVSDSEDDEIEITEDDLKCLMFEEDTRPIKTYSGMKGQIDFLMGEVYEVFQQRDTAQENITFLQKNCSSLREECLSLSKQLERVVAISEKYKAENFDLTKQLNDAKSQLRDATNKIEDMKKSGEEHVILKRKINDLLNGDNCVLYDGHPKRVIEIKSESEQEEEEEDYE